MSTLAFRLANESDIPPLAALRNGMAGRLTPAAAFAKPVFVIYRKVPLVYYELLC
jgi:hypothetical protein